MLYKEIIAVCSQIHTKHINTLCGQNVELLNVKTSESIVIAGLQGSLCTKVKEVFKLRILISFFTSTFVGEKNRFDDYLMSYG
jgi:hypothetical protein